MASFEGIPRVGRSQGAVIFWGLVSVFFASAFCYYFSKNRENEKSANVLRDQVLALQEERDSLQSQKENLQGRMSETEATLKVRENILQDKETTLAGEETRLENQAQAQTQNPGQGSPLQAMVLKKFSDAIAKIDKADGVDVTDRAGRPVLRIPNSVLFNSGEAVLKPESKPLLNQMAQVLSGQADHFELRIETFTDSDAESAKGEAKSHFPSGWELTSARALALARYYRDQTSLPFANVLTVARGDSAPVSSGKDARARSRRIEISLTPSPVPFHSTEAAHTVSTTPPPAPVNPLTPPPDPPASAKK